jgi:hypothetical protein
MGGLVRLTGPRRVEKKCVDTPLRWVRRAWLSLAVIACAVVLPAPLSADELAEPSGPVILTVSGMISETNAPSEARFDRAMLEALGLETLVSHTNWTTGPQTFEGVPVISVLDAVGAEGTMANSIALNDYTVEIPFSDFSTYRVLLALKMNGTYIRVRDKGPIWIVYPRDEHPELDRPEMWRRWIWQLKRIEIR